MLAKLLFAAQAACCNRAEKKGDEKAKEKNNRQKQIQRPGQMQRRKNMLCQVRKELSLLNAADQMSQEIGSLKKQPEKHCCYLDRKLADGKAADTRTPRQKEALHRLVHELLQRYPEAKVVGHRDLSPDTNYNGIVDPWERIKECPCFEVIGEFSIN